MAADAALVVVDGVAGVEVQTEKVWDFANDFKLPRGIIINKLDRERADFQRSLDSVQETFGRAAVPVQIPIGSERDFSGVVDLVRMKAYTYAPDGDGKGTEGDIPGNLADAAPEGPRNPGGNGRRRQRRPHGRVLRQGDAASPNTSWKVCARPSARCAFSRCCAPPPCTTSATDRFSTSCVENLPAPIDRDAVAATVNGTESAREDRREGPAVRVTFSRPRPTRSPAASPTSRCTAAW